MISYEDMCVGCPPNMGCLGSGCPYRNVPICSCDECKEEFDPEDLYMTDIDEMLCSSCLLKRYKTVAQERGW